MKLIYNNFDGLEDTFQGVLPAPLLYQLEEARNNAQALKREVIIELGRHKIPCKVAETGAKGGFRYRFDTGPDGETWFAARSTRRDTWGIRVSCHSLALALYGYWGVKGRILEKLLLMQAEGPGGPPIERVSRVDYCFDFLAAEPFEPDPKYFVAHQRCKKECHAEKQTIETFTAAQGDQVQTIMVGKMPGRQALIYNKTIEISRSSKAYWRDIWQLPADLSGTVWRIEVRAGKNELDTWNIRRWADCESKIGDVILRTLNVMRYVTPTADSNRSRWPTAPIWQAAIDKAGEALAEHICKADREKILEGFKFTMQQQYRTLILGNAIGLVAACDHEWPDVPLVLGNLGKELVEMVQNNEECAVEKFEFQKNRQRFLR